MLNREEYFQAIGRHFKIHKVCALLGPRQCGKTTLAKQYIKSVPGKVTIFDLEDPTDLSKLDVPKLTLEELDGLIVIDEIQRRPELFTYLRVLVDKYPDRRYLILGSASRDLINQSSETLAGRIGFIEVRPFSLREAPDLPKRWQRGGYPLSYLAEDTESSQLWRKSYITTFIERDLIALGGASRIDVRRLWAMLAHYHGNFLNYSEIGKSFGISDHTIKRYVGLLEQTFMIRILKPWFENLMKRQVKTPKIYIRDSGLFHSLLDIGDKQLTLNPKAGASWEGFALEEIIHYEGIDSESCYFWSTSNQAELDLLLAKGEKKVGFEFKYTDSPKATKSMHISLRDLKLDFLTVIVPIEVDFLLADNIRAVGLKTYLGLT